MSTPRPEAPSPIVFGFPEAFQWKHRPKELGTIIVPHTLRLGPLRVPQRLTGYVVDGDQETDRRWQGFGITHPGGGGSHAFPTLDNYVLPSRGQFGINALDDSELALARTGLRFNAKLVLAVGLATYYQVGPEARVVSVTSNKDFDPEVAEELMADPAIDVANPARAEALASHGFDPARFLVSAFAHLEPQGELEIGTSLENSPRRITSFNFDLVAGPALTDN